MIQIRQAQDLTLCLQLLARAVPYDTHGAGAGQVEDMTRGCVLFELVDGGQVVGAFAARSDDYSDGRQLSVTCAGGLPGYDLVGVMDAWMTLQAVGPAGARVLTCTTRRPGLVKRLKRAGYSVAGYVMKKEVTYGRA